MKSIAKFIAVLILFTNESMAQSPAPELESPAVQSPYASSLGKYGEIPVSLFNGRVDISIPLVSIRNKDIEIPIRLDYDAGGLRPDEHPSWTGLGWTLMAGGVIKRHVNGKIDERTYPSQPEYANPNVGYIYHYADMANPSWSDPDYQGTSDAPDEFSFNVNGLSGYFMLNHEGKWIVKSNDPSIAIEVEMANNYQLLNLKGNRPITLPKVFKKFTLIAKDGTKYIFGREQSAIEFSMPSLPYKVESYNFHPSDRVLTPKIFYNCLGSNTSPDIYCWEVVQNVTTSAWHLSEIISPRGATVNFEYESKLSLLQSVYSEIANRQKSSSSYTFYTGDINQVNKTLIVSAYLKKIACNNGAVCEFSKSPSNELKWVVNTKPESQDFFDPYEYFGETWEYLKLDNIVLKFQTDNVKKIYFNYIENPSERLKLEKVIFTEKSSASTVPEYSLLYSSKKLPAYNTGLEDHWGYYNGKNFWSGVSKQEHVGFPNIANYYNSREPDAQFMDAEIITQIKYPTGGYSKFYFEPHTYSQQVNQSPDIVLENLNQNYSAGGLRIKKIESQESGLATPIVKEYFYSKNYIGNGQLSSGVLSGKPYYYNEIQNNFYGSIKRFSSSPLNYLNTTNGNHITYSEVTEKAGEGYIVYTYTNQDNGYLDKPPFAMVSRDNQSIFDFKLFGKLDLERGQLKSRVFYNTNKIPLKEIINTYNDDPNRYNTYVRSLNYSPGYSLNKVMFPIYTFRTFLKKEEVKEFGADGFFLTTTTEYRYDNFNNVTLKTIVNSKAQVIKEEYKYPDNFPSDPILTDMKKNHILNPIIEARSSLDNVQQNFTRVNFYSPFANVFHPKTIQVQAKTSDPLETRQIINFYDFYGNPAEVQKADDIKTAYFWGYRGQYPTVKVVNASSNTRQVTYKDNYAYRSRIDNFTLPATHGSQTFTFKVGKAGDLIITLPGYLGEDWAGTFVVRGPDTYSESGGLLSRRSSGLPNVDPWQTYSSNSYYKLSNTLSNVSAGDYTLDVYYESRNAWYETSSDQLYIEYTEKYVESTDEIVTGSNHWYYEGFEEGYITGNGSAGTGYYKDDYDLGDLHLDPGQHYVLNYHYYDGVWKNKTVPYEVGMVLTDGSAIDEVRVYPENAYMYTYTYEPLVGMTSETDPNGKTIYYEYDAFNRLSLIRDKDRNILKKVCYNYAGQPENCPTNSPLPNPQDPPVFPTVSTEPNSTTLVLQADYSESAATSVTITSVDWAYSETFDFPADNTVAPTVVRLPDNSSGYTFTFHSPKAAPYYTASSAIFFEYTLLPGDITVRIADGTSTNAALHVMTETLFEETDDTQVYTITAAIE